MTIQSVASTVGMPRNFTTVARFSPPRTPAFELAADALPRARVLVVEREALVALDLQRTLREAGFRAIGPAATLGEIQRLIEQGPIDCAIVGVDANPGTPLPVSDLLTFANVPFAFVANGDSADIPQRQAPGAEAL